MTENLKLEFGHDDDNIYGAVDTSTGNITRLTMDNTETTNTDFSWAEHDTQTAIGTVWPDTENAVPHSFYDSSADPLKTKGVFYNAYVASAGYVRQENLSSTHYFHTSICPKNWRMFNLESFTQLMSIYNGLEYDDYLSVDTDDNAMISPISLTWSGYYNYRTGTWNSRNVSYEMWTNRYQSNGNVTRIYFRNDGVGSEPLTSYVSGGAPYHGRPVRCWISV